MATYYDTHDTSTEMEHGEWVQPLPLSTQEWERLYAHLEEDE